MAATKNTPLNGDISSEMSGTTSTAENIKASAGRAFEQAQDKVGEAAGKATQTAKAQLSDRKDQVADGIDNVASALRSTGEQLRDGDAGFVGDYVNKAADTVSGISRHLRENDLGQLLRETEDFARREPTIFLGSAFALGVLAARFLKSSSERRYGGATQRNEGYAPVRMDYNRDASKEW